MVDTKTIKTTSKVLLLFLLSFTFLFSGLCPQEIYAATGDSINLVSGEGSSTGTISSYSSNIHSINVTIPSNKMVIISLSNISSTNDCSIYLQTSSGVEPSTYSGGWYGLSKMKYYKTSQTTSYRVVVNSSTYSGSYTINVKVSEAISLTKQDTASNNDSSKNTYCISSSPEVISSNYQKGEWGYYLQRSIVEGNANIYWEHQNLYQANMKFGVLLYNPSTLNGGQSVTVTLNSRNYKAWYESAMAMSDVWVGWMNGTKTSDLSDLTSSITINPGESKWISLYNVPYYVSNPTDEVLNTFNGVENITISSGMKLYCDTYIMTPGYETATKNNAANATRANGDTNGIRGAGPAAMMYNWQTSTINISSSSPYSVVLGGYDAPNINSGEKVSIYDSLGTAGNSYNYGTVYKLIFNNLSSSSTIKGKIKCNPKVSPNLAGDPNTAWSGNMFVTVAGSGMYPTGYRIKNDNREATFCANVPKGQQVVYYVVVSGQSNFPLEVSFEN